MYVCLYVNADLQFGLSGLEFDSCLGNVCADVGDGLHLRSGLTLSRIIDIALNTLQPHQGTSTSSIDQIRF